MINLAVDNPAVLRHAYKPLRTGGEMYFAYFVDLGFGVPEVGHLMVA